MAESPWEPCRPRVAPSYMPMLAMARKHLFSYARAVRSDSQLRTSPWLMLLGSEERCRRISAPFIIVQRAFSGNPSSPQVSSPMLPISVRATGNSAFRPNRATNSL